TVAAADGNASAPGRGSCEVFCHVDLKDRAGLLAAAEKVRSKQGLGAVFTAGTDFSAMVASLAEALGLPGHSFEAARAASDKLIMRKCFDVAGLPSPRFVEVSASSPDSIVFSLGLPLVVKPADNMGARGCRLARSRDELRASIDAALPLSRTGRVIVEEYIEGPEFSIDALIYDDQLHIHGFADRHIHFSPYFVELGHTIPSDASPELRDRVLAVFEASVRSLGLSHGAAKGDMKWCPSRSTPMIGEIAARLSGGYMSGWTYPYSSGHDLTRDALLLAAGLRPAVRQSDRGWTSAERAFISVPGKVAFTSGLRAALASPGIKDLFVRAEPGDRVVFPSNNVEKCGNLISQSPDRAAAVAAAEAAIRGILIRLEAPNASTEAFLRGEGLIHVMDGLTWPPLAFRLSPEQSALLDALPEYIGSETSPSWSPDDLIGITAFPGGGSITGLDWSGRGFAESALMAMEIGGAVVAPGATGPRLPLLAGRFWRALARGGVQAALYVLDSSRKADSAP
ncbi:MAG: ATP-grasp domain-containing protein, partial [Spirochaetota bacterium]